MERYEKEEMNWLINKPRGLLLTRRSERRFAELWGYDEQKAYKYSVGIHRSVKKQNTTIPRMPSGMRPTFNKQGCIPTECLVLYVDAIFYRAIFPMGMMVSWIVIDDKEVTAYDKNGNINTLQRSARNSPTASTATLVDDLMLGHTGNQLKNVTDAVSASTSIIGYVKPNATAPTISVEYNKNGAIKYNYHNEIAGIAYNILNLPEKIRFMYGHATQYSTTLRLKTSFIFNRIKHRK